MLTDTIAEARNPLNIIALADEALLRLTSAAADAPECAAGSLDDLTAAQVWTAVAKRLGSYQGGRYARRADPGFRDLHARLADLLDDVRTEAAEPGLLLRRYVAIRDAQQALVQAATRRASELELDNGLRVPPGQLMLHVGAISNVDEVWPDWRNRARGTFALQPPWEHDASQPATIKHTAANLRWLATSEAQPWVPTLGEAGRALAEQMAAEEKRLNTPREEKTHVQVSNVWIPSVTR